MSKVFAVAVLVLLALWGWFCNSLLRDKGEPTRYLHKNARKRVTHTSGSRQSFALRYARFYKQRQDSGSDPLFTFSAPLYLSRETKRVHEALLSQPHITQANLFTKE